MGWIRELLGVDHKKLGSANCPKCGRFSKVLRIQDLYTGYDVAHTVTVKCWRCGVQDIS